MGINVGPGRRIFAAGFAANHLVVLPFRLALYLRQSHRYIYIYIYC